LETNYAKDAVSISMSPQQQPMYRIPSKPRLGKYALGRIRRWLKYGKVK